MRRSLIIFTAGDVAIAPYNPKGFKEMEKYGFYFSPIKIFEYKACGTKFFGIGR